MRNYCERDAEAFRRLSSWESLSYVFIKPGKWTSHLLMFPKKAKIFNGINNGCLNRQDVKQARKQVGVICKNL